MVSNELRPILEDIVLKLQSEAAKAEFEEEVSRLAIGYSMSRYLKKKEISKRLKGLYDYAKTLYDKVEKP